MSVKSARYASLSTTTKRACTEPISMQQQQITASEKRRREKGCTVNGEYTTLRYKIHGRE
jgi:hypothetical protein